jgi:urease accessory protein UreE
MALLLNRIGKATGEVVPVRIARIDLWKRRWRQVAENGEEIAVDLEAPARNGEILLGDEGCFRIEQTAEEVIAIAMPSKPDLAAKIGWYLGNRHIPIEVRPDEILLENFPTLVDSLARIGIAYIVREDVLNCRPHSEDHRH